MIMAERLTRRKRIRGGHRASTTNILGRIDNLLADGTDTIDTSKLSQLKLTLEEKSGTLKQLDSKILELTEEDGLVDEIEQADLFKNTLGGSFGEYSCHAIEKSQTLVQQAGV